MNKLKKIAKQCSLLIFSVFFVFFSNCKQRNHYAYALERWAKSDALGTMIEIEAGLAQTPSDTRFYALKAIVYKKLRDNEAAALWAIKALNEKDVCDTCLIPLLEIICLAGDTNRAMMYAEQQQVEQPFLKARLIAFKASLIDDDVMRKELLYRQALAIDSTAPEIWFQFAQLAGNKFVEGKPCQGDCFDVYAKAIDVLESKAFLNADVLLLKARIAFYQKQWQEALSSISAALQFEPANKYLKLYKAVILSRLDSIVSPESDFRSMENEFRQHPVYWLERAYYESRVLQNQELANISFARALSLNPGVANRYKQEGINY